MNAAAEPYDVLVVGGGPAGLSAALTFGRARKRALLSDAGPPRNAAAVHIHNFVTRDGTPPAEFRRTGREQLRPYSSVQIVDERVEAIDGVRGAFRVRLPSSSVEARRVLLCCGMIDELPSIEGFRELWGTSIFICPYCHGWEVRDQRFAFLASSAPHLDFALLLRSWTNDVVVLTQGLFDVPEDVAAGFARARIRVDARPVVRLRAKGDALEAVEFNDGDVLERDILFAQPPQRQTPLVASLGLALDSRGLVQVDEMQSSTPGIYAAGDLVNPAQGAVLAAASGMLAAAMVNRSLAADWMTARPISRTSHNPVTRR